MAVETLTKKSEGSFPYIVVHGVRTGPSFVVGMKVSLAYVDVTETQALDIVSRVNPFVQVTGITKYE